MQPDNRKVVLHIGLPKTATTSIQDTLFLNNQFLRDTYGIDYCPGLCALGGNKQRAHHGITWQEFNQEHLFYGEINPADVKKYLQFASNALLSSEWLVLGNRKSIANLIKNWGLPNDREIVVVVRNEYDYVRSRWLQSVKMGHTFISLQEYYFKIYKKNRKTIAEIVRPWEENDFSVKIIKFEGLKESGHDLTLEFINKLYGSNITPSDWRSVDASNVSPSSNKVNLYRIIIKVVSKIPFLNIASGDYFSGPKYKWLHDSVCRWLPQISWMGPSDRNIQEDILLLSPFNDLSCHKSLISMKKSRQPNSVDTQARTKPVPR